MQRKNRRKILKPNHKTADCCIFGQLKSKKRKKWRIDTEKKLLFAIRLMIVSDSIEKNALCKIVRATAIETNNLCPKSANEQYEIFRAWCWSLWFFCLLNFFPFFYFVFMFCLVLVVFFFPYRSHFVRTEQRNHWFFVFVIFQSDYIHMMLHQKLKLVKYILIVCLIFTSVFTCILPKIKSSVWFDIDFISQIGIFSLLFDFRFLLHKSFCSFD